MAKFGGQFLAISQEKLKNHAITPSFEKNFFSFLIL
jgi:hypothetical protein|tara:strand:+ start:262 stop:369 length:108 start_codon:yes stop_codon:yes gene_type:complete